jgi:hypothetical protein
MCNFSAASAAYRQLISVAGRGSCILVCVREEGVLRLCVFGVGGGGKGPQSCCEPVKEHRRINLFGGGGNEAVEAAVRTLKGQRSAIGLIYFVEEQSAKTSSSCRDG